MKGIFRPQPAWRILPRLLGVEEEGHGILGRVAQPLSRKVASQYWAGM